MTETMKGGTFDGFEVVSYYGREQAIDDGMLADVTEWASAKAGFLGGFRCPVVMTSKLWHAVNEQHAHQDTRGRAHDVLFLASIAMRRALARADYMEDFDCRLTVGRSQVQRLRVISDGDGVTVGFAEDEW